ncbi:unnamed protein product [Brassica napus]|uniref:(rape) hypothetical protein n=1 Tax=Brassica napus TaxID=3708 RepID=A0A816LT77_BRANA|nr:unnamed protein product [Brassica napus]
MSSSSFFCIVSPIGELLTTIHLIAVAVSIYLIAVAVSIYLIATASTVHLVATASSTTAIFVVPPTSLSVDVHPTLFLGAAPLLARKTTGSTQPELGSPDLLGFASPRRLHHSTLPQIPPPRPDSLWLHLTLVRLHCVSTLFRLSLLHLRHQCCSFGRHNFLLLLLRRRHICLVTV